MSIAEKVDCLKGVENRLILPMISLEWTSYRVVNGHHVLLTASDGMAHVTKGEHDDIFSMQKLRKKERPKGRMPERL